MGKKKSVFERLQELPVPKRKAELDKVILVEGVKDFFNEFLDTDEGYYFCRLLEGYIKEANRKSGGVLK